MGSRGSFLKPSGFLKQEWKEVGEYKGIKILKRKSELAKNNLPYYSKTPGTGYIKLDNLNRFNQFRQYGENRKPVLDLEYNEHKHKLSLHVHYFQNGIRDKEPIIIATPKDGIIDKKLYKKYKSILKGIKL